MLNSITVVLVNAILFQLVAGIFLALPAQDKKKEKITLAVLPIETSGGISETESNVLTDRLRSELVKLDYFTVVERSKMADILKEQGFSLSGCVSSECAVEAGKLLGVRLMVAGDVGKVGDVITVDARIINVETGEILKATQFDHRGDVSELLTVVKMIALRLVGKDDSELNDDKGGFPWLWVGVGAATAGALVFFLMGTESTSSTDAGVTNLPEAPWPPAK